MENRNYKGGSTRLDESSLLGVAMSQGVAKA